MSQETPFSLDELRLASPCSAEWAAMTGDDRVRACGLCKKNVYDLSALTRAEAERLLVEKEGQLCVRFFRRADGRVLTADCPVGVATLVRRRLAQLTAILGFCVAWVVAAVRNEPQGTGTIITVPLSLYMQPRCNRASTGIPASPPPMAYQTRASLSELPVPPKKD